MIVIRKVENDLSRSGLFQILWHTSGLLGCRHAQNFMRLPSGTPNE